MGSPVLQRVALPKPRLGGEVSLEAALHERRSIREFRDAALTLSDLSQILWAAQGITNPSGFRTAPSAGALYPLECHLLAGRVSELPVAIYRYDPLRHDLSETVGGDRRAGLARAALGQTWIAAAAAILVLAAVDRRTTGKYGERGLRYIHIEAGHAAQNVYLQAAALELGTTIVGAFNDEHVHELLEMQPEERPICLLPIGQP